MMRNERGVVTIEFIFSLVIAAGLSVVLFSVTYALSVFEITQYVVYSAARAQLGGNLDSDKQREAAINKFKQLTTGKSAIATLYNGTWFEIVKPDALDVRGGPSSTNGNLFSSDLAGGSDMPNRNWFQGVSAKLNAKILNLNMPILGRTNPDDNENAFQTRLNAILIREPSQKECKDFMESRRQALSGLPSGEGFYKPGSYVPLEDNGC